VLLDRHPCAGFPVPVEQSPKRPRMSAGRYQVMREVARRVYPEFELALILAHETGHRISSIRQLEWADIRWDEQMIRWRAESDKEGVAHSTPLSPEALHALSDVRGRSLAMGEVPIFRDARGRPRERFLFTKWWHRAEVLAGLEHDQRWGFHSLRRQFATELKDEPLADVAALGGWKSTTTLLSCYISADPATMKRALARRRALADERVESTTGEQETQS